MGCDVGTVSTKHENYQTIDRDSEKPWRHYLNTTVKFTVSGKGVTIHSIKGGMYGTEQLKVTCVFRRMKNLWASCW